VLDTKYKCPSSPSNADVSQVVTYAEVKGCEHAILIYPQTLENPLNERLGDIRVRTLAFQIDGDLESAGRSFLEKLGLERMLIGASCL
jgi:5-methylcytosine-specific restriction enzyme subunit McrC